MEVCLVNSIGNDKPLGWLISLSGKKHYGWGGGDLEKAVGVQVTNFYFWALSAEISNRVNLTLHPCTLHSVSLCTLHFQFEKYSSRTFGQISISPLPPYQWWPKKMN